MTLLYDLVFLVFAIIYLPYLFISGRFHRDIWQRFAIYPKRVRDEVAGKGVIWVHAVSVGEVMAASTLCEKLIKKYPKRRLVISTITKTGNAIAKRLFSGTATIIYLPVDLSLFVRRAIRIIRPEIFIIVETEIWPNLILRLQRDSIPAVLVNGRISPKSFRLYKSARFLFKGVLDKITLFSMQTQEYADRIIEMGAPASKVVVTGNMKFDAAIRDGKAGLADARTLRNDLGLREGEQLFMAGSTHSPEEEMVLRAYKGMLESMPGLRLLIAPRHVERVGEIEGIVRNFGLKSLRISQMEQERRRYPTVQSPTTVLILDTMGQLSKLYSAATVIFMGGSLMKRGGQNILEPAIFSKPIIFGPHMFNFKDIAESFIRESAARMVKGEDELKDVTSLLFKEKAERDGLGKRARALIEKNKGATERNVGAIVKAI